MTLQFLIGGKRHAFTVEEARALHAELTAFFGSYVVDRARLPAGARGEEPAAGRAHSTQGEVIPFQSSPCAPVQGE